MNKKWALNAVLLISATLISLVAAEYVLRRINIVDTMYHLMLRVPHPVLGWRLMPGASYVNTYADEPVDVVFNKNGWRDVEHVQKKPAGVYRVLILGDSFMEAYSVNIEHSFSRILEQSLNQSRRKVEVINFGVGGYGTLQEFLAFTEYGKDYQPDLVLLMFFLGNDLKDNSYLFYAGRKGDSLKVIGRPFLDPTASGEWKIIPPDYERAMRIYKDELEYQKTLRGKIAMRSVLFYGVRKLYGKMLDEYKSNFTDVRNPSVTDKNRNRDAPDAGKNTMKSKSDHRSRPVWRESAWETTAIILRKLKEEVEAAHSRLLVASVPSRSDVGYNKKTGVYDKGVSEALTDSKVDTDYARLEQMLKKLAISYIDLRQPFRELTTAHNIELFGSRDPHWNANGHSHAAKLVSEEILKRTPDSG